MEMEARQQHQSMASMRPQDDLDKYGKPKHLHSFLRKYDPKENWGGEYYNFPEFDQETQNPSDYLSELGALAQTTAHTSLSEMEVMSLEEQR